MRQTPQKVFLSGILWSSLGSYVAQGAQMASSLVMAALLMPADFGLFAASVAFISWFGLSRDLGFNNALIYHQEEDREATSTVFWVVLAIGFILSMATFLGAPLAGALFNDARLTPIVKTLSLTFLLNSLGAVPNTILRKRLQFRRRTIPTILSSMSYVAIALILAYKGYGVWSLVYAWLSSQAVACLSYWVLSPFRPMLYFSQRKAAQLFAFGGFSTLTDVAIFGFLTMIPTVIGRTLGIAALGYFNFAYRIASLPAERITPIFLDVAFPLYAQFQKKVDTIKENHLLSTRYLALIVMPISTYLAFLGPILLEILYGDKWLRSAPSLQVLSFYGMTVGLWAPMGAILLAIGKPQVHFKILTLETIVTFPLLIVISQRFDIIGAAILLTLAHFIFTLMVAIRANQFIKVSAREYLTCLKTPLISTSIATGILLLTMNLYPTLATAFWINFMLLSAGYGVVYSTLVLALDRNLRRRAIAALILFRSHVVTGG